MNEEEVNKSQDRVISGDIVLLSDIVESAIDKINSEDCLNKTSEEEINEGLDKINKQVELAPLTREQYKEQFVAITEELRLDHAFNFDDAWELLKEIRRKRRSEKLGLTLVDDAWEIAKEVNKRRKFREDITILENQIINIEGTLTGEELHKYNPLKHSFADGCYIREIFNPAGLLLVTKIHKKKHPFFLMSGEMSILTENGIERVKAPHHGITYPGTKRIIYTHTDCIFITVHVTDSTNIQEIEEVIIAKDFSDPEITLDDINILKESGINIEDIKNNNMNDKNNII